MIKNIHSKQASSLKILCCFIVFLLFVSYAQAFPDFMTAPSAPTNLTVTNAARSQFTANWTASPGATSYRIDVSESSNFSAGNILLNVTTTPSTPTSFLVTGLQPGTLYYFRLRAVNVEGTSPNSFIHSLVTPPDTPIIRGIISIGTSQFVTRWSGRLGSTDFRLDVSTSSTFSSFVYHNISTNHDSIFTVKNLLPLTKYYYRVRALNSLGTSANSDVADATTLAALPAKPRVLPATHIMPANFNANWSPAGAIGNTVYFVDVGTDSTFQHLLPSNTVGISDSTYKVSLPTHYAMLWYRVRGQNAYGYSPYSDIAVVTLPANLAGEQNAMIANELKVYPNPIRSHELLNVELDKLDPGTEVKITITTLAGDKSTGFSLHANDAGILRARIPMTTLTPGTYILKVQNMNLRFIVH